MRSLAEPRDLIALAALCASILGPATAQAHFVLTAPAANFEQGGLGDPQKAPPCGDDGTAVATGVVTPYQAGDTVTITIEETIFHPGHYRVAIAVNDVSELPPEPEVTPDVEPPGMWDCGTAEIMDPAVFPVLADGVLVHSDPFDAPQAIEVVLPDDLNCTNCTLQIIQFMSEHGENNPGGCYYHHCAQISVAGGATDESGTGGAEDSSSGGATNGDDTTADPTVATGPTDPTDATDPTNASATASTTATTTAGTSSDTDDAAGSNDDEDDGCSCSSDSGDPPAVMVGVLGLLGLRRRRRAR